MVARAAAHVRRRAADETGVRERAALAIDKVGLGAARANHAGTLSHGEQRQLEIAMVLATEPKLLLLDEPLAGMGADEARAHDRAASRR